MVHEKKEKRFVGELIKVETSFGLASYSDR